MASSPMNKLVCLFLKAPNLQWKSNKSLVSKAAPSFHFGSGITAPWGSYRPLEFIMIAADRDTILSFTGALHWTASFLLPNVLAFRPWHCSHTSFFFSLLIWKHYHLNYLIWFSQNSIRQGSCNNFHIINGAWDIPSLAPKYAGAGNPVVSP